MKGDYSERMAFSQNPFAHTCKIHKSDQHFFGDNRENSNFAVKGVPFSAIFVGTYEETIFSEHGGKSNDMKSPQGQKNETAGIRTPAYKTALRKQRKCTYTFRFFELTPQKNEHFSRTKSAPHPTGSE